MATLTVEGRFDGVQPRLIHSQESTYCVEKLFGGSLRQSWGASNHQLSNDH